MSNRRGTRLVTMTSAALLLLSLTAAVAPSYGAPAVALQPVVTGLSKPVYLTSPPGDLTHLFIVEKTGAVRIFKNGVLLAHPFLDLTGTVSGWGEQGLLSIAFDPDFATNRFVYADYTNLSFDTRVVRYRVSKTQPNRVDRSTARVLLRVDQPFMNHNGGQLQFGPDGRLYVGMGDGGNAGDPGNRAQNPRSRLGKLLRLNVRVSPARVSIYAKGLRNPWRFSFDNATGDLWIGDVGQTSYEEIDYLAAGTPRGTNFGWSGYEATHVYNAARAATLDPTTLTWPVAEYPHPLGEAVVGGYVYHGSAIPDLQGTYLYADFETGIVWAKTAPAAPEFELTGATRQLTLITSFGQDAGGELYLLTIDGSVYRIVPVI